MTRNLYIFSFFLLFLSACGVGIGNPVVDVKDDDFAKPISQYHSYQVDRLGGVDCGDFTALNSEGEINQGRACIHEAFSKCQAAKYLIDKDPSGDGRFVSFVWITPTKDATCTVSAMTASTDTAIYFGLYESSCSQLRETEQIEFACYGLENDEQLSVPKPGRLPEKEKPDPLR